MLRLLKTKNIKSICVFDGLHLLAKKKTEKDRMELKSNNRQQGL